MLSCFGIKVKCSCLLPYPASALQLMSQHGPNKGSASAHVHATCHVLAMSQQPAAQAIHAVDRPTHWMATYSMYSLKTVYLLAQAIHAVGSHLMSWSVDCVLTINRHN